VSAVSRILRFDDIERDRDPLQLASPATVDQTVITGVHRLRAGQRRCAARRNSQVKDPDRYASTRG
jgi:hypothetical protein